MGFPVAFISYASEDDQRDKGRIRGICERLQDELKRISNRDLVIFWDADAIEWGANWRKEIDAALERVVLFIPVVTPSFLASKECRRELLHFAKRERKQGRTDLILPLYYLECAEFSQGTPLRSPKVVRTLKSRQMHALWRLSDKSLSDRLVKLSIEDLAKTIFARYEEASGSRADMMKQHSSALSARRQKSSFLVSRRSLEKRDRLPGEVFFSEVLKRDVVLERQDGQVVVNIDRNDVTHAVISVPGRKALSDHYASVASRQGDLLELDRAYHQFLLGKEPADRMVIDVGRFPLRWASGGAISVITRPDRTGRKRTWVPLFFRDIEPFGWHLAIGASERCFTRDGVLVNDVEDELRDPTQLAVREFLEETSILSNSPVRGKNLAAQFVFPLGAAFGQLKEFWSDHYKLRADCDGIRIEQDTRDRVKVRIVNTGMSIAVQSPGGIGAAINDVLVCVNLHELGIEVIKVFAYDLEERHYLLCGELLVTDAATPNQKIELGRQPVVLFSCDFLRSVFDQGLKDLESQTAPGSVLPSFVARDAIPDSEVIVFDWDVKKRFAIIEGQAKGSKPEIERCLRWSERFGSAFRSLERLPRLFTPPTAKILSLLFNKTDGPLVEPASRGAL